MPLYSRREFSKLGGFAAAAVVGGRVAAPESGKRVGYCIVGLGRISMDHFMPGTKASKYGKVTALVSGHPDKARKQAAEYGIPESAIYSYEQYDRIKDNAAIDAVYIALPNSMHAEYTIRAAEAGKHVLCEKPMATTVADAKNMIAACKGAGKKLMIAYRCHLETVNQKAVSLVRSGVLGKIQAIESANGFNIQAGEWRLDKKLAGGGPMLDVGIYSLNACRMLTGEEPEVVSAYSSVIDHDGRFAQVEENTGWTMRFPSGIVASCNTSYGAGLDGYYRVHGSRGSIQLQPAFAYEGIHLTGSARGDDGGKQVFDVMEPGRDPDQFVVESDYFSNCILTGAPVEPDGAEGLRDMELMERILRSSGVAPVAGTVYPWKNAANGTPRRD